MHVLLVILYLPCLVTHCCSLQASSPSHVNVDAAATTDAEQAGKTARQRPPTGLSGSGPTVSPALLAHPAPAVSSSDSSVLEPPPGLLPQLPPAPADRVFERPPGLPLPPLPADRALERPPGLPVPPPPADRAFKRPPGLPVPPGPAESSVDMASLPPGLASSGLGSSSDSGITVRYRTPRGNRGGKSQWFTSADPKKNGRTLRGIPLAVLGNVEYGS